MLPNPAMSNPAKDPSEEEQQQINVKEAETGQRGRRPIEKKESISDLLTHPETQTQLKYLGSLYTLIGLGFGLLMLIIDNQFLGDGTSAELLSGVISAVLFGLLIFIGPIIAAFSSNEISRRFEDNPKQAWVTSAVGNGGGFIAMVIMTVLFVNSVSSGGGGGGGELFNLSNLLVPLILLAIPTALVGVGATYLYRQFK